MEQRNPDEITTQPRTRLKSDELDLYEIGLETREKYQWHEILEMEEAKEMQFKVHGLNSDFSEYNIQDFAQVYSDPFIEYEASQLVTDDNSTSLDPDPEKQNCPKDISDGDGYSWGDPVCNAGINFSVDAQEILERVLPFSKPSLDLEHLTTCISSLVVVAEETDEEFEVVTSRKTRQRFKAEQKRNKLPSQPRENSIFTKQRSTSTHSNSSTPTKFEYLAEMAPNKRRNDHHGMGAELHGHMGNQSRPLKCSVPTECLQPGKLIYVDEIGASETEIVKIICNNDHCDQGSFMHKECFDLWEQTILTYLRSCGRARSWSEKQRLQNLWTKRGYDLAFKACGCKCGKGHIRKDLNWIQPVKTAPIAIPAAGGARLEQPPQQQQDQIQDDVEGAGAALQGLNIQGGNGDGKKKKKSKAKEARPTLAISAPIPHPNNNHARMTGESFPGTSKGMGQSHSPPSAGTSSGSIDSGIGMLMQNSGRNRINSVSSNGSTSSSCSGSGSGSGSPPSPSAQFSSPQNISGSANHFKFQRKPSKGNDILMERTRRDSGGLFCRRMDFSSFNQLPRHKLNSYQIKMEEESHGNDETRNFVLTTLTNSKVFRVCCVICNTNMPIFDRFPLIDGTFFVSPMQHVKSSVEIQNHSTDGRPQYLSAVCMGCLQGWFTSLYCRTCGMRWDGSSLVLGSCYSYDIFAASPCCHPRLECLNCKAMVIQPELRPPFFSDYSKKYSCQNCGLITHHLVKPLPSIFNRVST